MAINSIPKDKVYLLVVDVTEEFTVAIDYASELAASHNAHIALLNVIEVDHFDHWGNIAEKVRSEMRTQAENMIWEASLRVTKKTGMIPMICISEGIRHEVIIETINQYPEIAMLILGGDCHASNPGPLVTFFAGKGLSKLRVPLMVVPGHLMVNELDNVN